jgi:4a-hydroxytetrahydrobiopterin dehydratase
MSPRFDVVELEQAPAQSDLLVSHRAPVLLILLPMDWQEVDGALQRTVECPSFPDAIAFVNRVAELAERENHHPDIAVSYKKVTLRWTTHSAGGITERDRELAARSDELVES